MQKNLSMITIGKIIADIREEGAIKGLDWRVPRLYVTRNEQSPRNIKRKLTDMKVRNPEEDFTEEDAKKSLLFPFYNNTEDQWRKYSPEEAEDLKMRIKLSRKYV